VGVYCQVGGGVGECCVYQLIFPRLITLWNSILCPKLKGYDWHKCAWLMGEWNLCGIKTLKIFLNECDAPPNSLKDSNVSLKVKTTKERIGVHSLVYNTLGVKRAC
jgi:hypothetical protein